MRIEELILLGVVLILWILWGIRNRMPVSGSALRKAAVDEMNYWRKRKWDAQNDVGKLDPTMVPDPWEGKMTADELGIGKDVLRNFRFEMELGSSKKSVTLYREIQEGILDERREELFVRTDKDTKEQGHSE
jgi:hypothetical protein